MFNIGDKVRWTESGFTPDYGIVGIVQSVTDKYLDGTYPVEVNFNDKGIYGFTSDGRRIESKKVVLVLEERLVIIEPEIYNPFSNRFWSLEVEVDENDGDYRETSTIIKNKDEFLSTYSDLINEIKNGIDFSWGVQLESEMEYYFEMFGKEFVEEFVDTYFPDCEYGFHRVVSIKLIEKEIFQTIELV